MSNFGRILPTPDPKSSMEHEIRQRILLGTLGAIEERSASRGYHKLAESNVQRWRSQARPASPGKCEVVVIKGDWGVVTSRLTEDHGTTFAALNMANAYVPGGGYTEGCPAQEENMFRRTDCHFSINRGDEATVRLCTDGFGDDVEYTPAMSRLLSGGQGMVYLDTASPRVCIRGPEDRNRDDLGYKFLPEDQVFPFYELRAAAVDLRGGGRFDADEMRRRITAQLNTLTAAGVRHVVLSAFGCGAFRNPAADVAVIYREEIGLRMSNFDVIAFAIYDAGYGPDNFTPFRKAFEGFAQSNGGSIAPVKSPLASAGNDSHVFSTPEKES